MSKSDSSLQKPIWKKIFNKNIKWEDKDEFLDIIYWGRQILAVIMGIIWGYLGLKGFFGISLFVIINSIAVYCYSINFNADDDVVENIKEGFMTSFASFLVSWTLIYSAMFFE